MSEKCNKFKQDKGSLPEIEGTVVSPGVIVDAGNCAHVVATETDKVILELIHRVEELEAQIKQIKDK